MYWLVYRIAQFMGGGCIFLSTVLGVLLRVDLSKYDLGATWVNRLQSIKDFAGLELIALGGISILCAFITKIIGPPWVWNVVRKTLDSIRTEAFTEDIDGDPVHYHRVTLFKRTWCFLPRPFRHHLWPWGLAKWAWYRAYLRLPACEWMVPVCRSGHTTLSTTTVFLASGDEYVDTEGVVGQAWQSRRVKCISGLPNLSSESDASVIADYCSAVHMPVALIEKRIAAGKTCSRALCAIPIEVRGSLWGVLVLDSTKPDAIAYKKNKSRDKSTLLDRTYPKVLGDLLEGIG